MAATKLGIGRSARRVVWWHRLFFGVPPTIVIGAAEVATGRVHAQLAGACRTLVGKHHLRVIVDAEEDGVSEVVVAGHAAGAG